MKKLLLSFALVIVMINLSNGQNNCDRRTFVSNVSLDLAGFTVLTYEDDLLDSLFWDFGDGLTEWQTSGVGSGAITHTYTNPGTYNVTLERWGVTGVPFNITPLHCTYTYPITIYSSFTDSICGSNFSTFIEGDTVTFSNQSVIQSPSFSTHPQHELWDFGNGQIGYYLNRIYPVVYTPGTYTACLYYMGFSFNNGGYLFNCESCTTFTIGSTKVNELSSSEIFNVFPNPAADHLSINTSVEVEALEIIDMLGQKVRSEYVKSSTQEYEVNIQELVNGIYFLKIKSTKGEKTVKFIKASN